MSTMNITKDEADFLNALRDHEKCAEIISVLLSDELSREFLLMPHGKQE